MQFPRNLSVFRGTDHFATFHRNALGGVCWEGWGSSQTLFTLVKLLVQPLLTLLFSQGRNVVVFYGSQTGTGEEFANRLSKDAQRYGMRGMAADPEEYDMVRIPPPPRCPSPLWTIVSVEHAAV